MNGKSRKRSARSKYDKVEICAALIDHSRDGIFIVSPRQQFVDVNPSGITMLGYSGDEIPKLFLPDIIHPEDSAQIELLELEAGRPLTVKCRLRHKNGKYLLLALEASKLSDGNFLVVFNRVSRHRPKQDQANQKNLEEIVNRSPAIAFLWRAAEGWPVEFVSDNIQQFGYTPRDFYSGGVAFASIVHPDDLERVAAEVSDYSQKGYREFTQEYRIITVDKEIRWVDDHTWVQRDEQGHVLNYQGIVLDITDRKQMEEALRESEEKFRSIVENSLAGIFIVDDSYRFIYANDELCRILGYPRDELTGLDFRKVLSEESQALVTDRYIRRQRGEQVPVRYELRVRRRDREERDVEMIVTVTKDASGKPRTMGQLVNITERKRLEHETEERRLFLESVLAAAPDAIVISDTRHLISEWNPGAERLFGYSAEEAIGRSIDELITGADSQVFDEATSWTQQIHSWRGITSAETIRYRKDGSPVNVIVSVAPILVGNEWVGVVAIYTDITGRKQAEMARQESEQKFRTVVQNAQAVIFILDLNGVFLLSEGQALAKLGLAPGQVVGSSVYQVYQDNRSVLDGITKSLAGELTRFTSVERGLVFDTVCSPYYSLEGELAGVIGIAIDITKRQQAEETLQMFQYTTDRARDAVQWLNREGGFEYVNEQACRSLGYTREELMRLHLWDIDPIYPKERWDKNWEDYQKGRQGGSESIETLHRRKDGSVFPVEVVSNHLWFGDRELHVAVVRDITERKQAEEALRKSEALYRQAIEVANAVPYHQTYHVNDISVKYDFIGEGIRQITGYAPEEFTEDLWDSLAQERVLLEELAGYSFNEAVEMVRSGVHPVWKCNHRIRAKDGSIHWVFEAAIELRDQDGISHGSIGMFQDITERKQAEAERENLISELTEKNSELERFTYTVSHDLKAPLITIAGFLGYLEQDAASGNTERLRSDIQRIQNAVNRMERLLNELLELSRIGRLMNSSETIPFAELVHETLDILHGQLEVRGVTVHTQPDLPDVYGDRQRLTEVLQNLIDNAVKFMGDQTDPRIEIGQHGEENNTPIFFVRDNGIGIAPEHTKQIFGLFDKLDSKTEGTGIGLALVKRIVELHGGRIWVESEAGKGATFYFTIQLKK